MPRRWPLYGAVLVYFAVLGGVGLVSLRGTGGHLIYPDDAYIAMATARNLHAHGVWGVTPFEFSGAATSLTWPVVLASSEGAIGRHDVTPLVLNVVIGVAVLTLVYAGLLRYVVDGWWQLAALVLLIGATPLPGLAFLGMEHTLQCLSAIALALAAVRACSSQDPRRRRRLIAMTAVCAALAVSTRYDTASVLIGVLIIMVVNAGWRPALAIASCAAVPPALYAAVAWRHGWPIVPIAVLEKGRLAEFGHSWSSVLRTVAAGVTALGDTRALAALVIGALLLLLLSVRRHEPAASEPRLLVTVFLIAALLHVQFGRIGPSYRYDAYVIALGLVANVSALAAVVPRFAPRVSFAWVAIAIALYPVAKRAVVSHIDMAETGRVAYEHEYQQGAFLARYQQPGATMIVDLGAVAYLSDLRLVDLGGLGSLDVAQLMLGDLDWTPDVYRRLAATHDVHVAIDVQGPLPLPPEWIRVAAWESPDQEVDFFALDAAATARLVHDLREYERDLPPRVTLRVFTK